MLPKGRGSKVKVTFELPQVTNLKFGRFPPLFLKI